MYNNNQNYPFPLRVCTKTQLARLYFPRASSDHIAVNHLNAWINRCTPLKEALLAIGYRKTQKVFTPKEVSLIVDFLGEP